MGWLLVLVMAYLKWQWTIQIGLFMEYLKWQWTIQIGLFMEYLKWQRTIQIGVYGASKVVVDHSDWCLWSVRSGSGPFRLVFMERQKW